MKRFMPLVLAVMLILTLTTHALAADDEYGYYPDEDWSYYDSDAGVQEWKSEWEAANPEIVAEILADDPPLWQSWGYESLEDFMLDFGFETEDDYYDFVLDLYTDDYYNDHINGQREAEYIRDTRLSMGGTEEGLAVMYNGAYISFPDAQPEYAGDLTAAPIRALIEALGGQVSYLPDTGGVKASINGTEMSFVIGSDTITADKDGETWTVDTDCAFYLKDGAAYAPVRSVCELAGYDVFWDQTYETAVILDRSAIIGEIDADFSILNKLFADDSTDKTKTYQVIGDILVSYTELNSLDGDQQTDVTVNINAIQNGLNQKMTINADLSQLIALFTGTDGYSPDEVTEAMLNSVSDFSMDVILNMDEACMYIKSNLFEALPGGIDKNTWVMFGSDYVGSAMAIYDNMLGSDWYSYLTSSETVTFGSLLYASSEYKGVFAYSELMETVGSAALLSDNMFVKNGTTYTLNVSLDNYDAFLKAVYGADYDEYMAEDFLDFYKELEFTLKISDNHGTVTTSGDFVIRENLYSSYSSDTRYSGSFTITANKVTAEFEVSEKNERKLLIDLKFTVAETDDTVAEAPPAGSTVLSVDDIGF